MTPSTLKEIEAEWLKRLEDAHAHYSHAVEYHQRMVEELDQWLTEDVDGSFAVAKAKRAMALALNEVVRCQEILVDLVLRKNMPPQDVDDEKLLI